jgi:RNA methyltransferase, TrmH family
MKPDRPSGRATPIASRRHPLIVFARKLTRRPVLARRQGYFLLDGIHLLEEALASRHEPEVVFVADRARRTPAGRVLVERIDARGWPLSFVADELLEELAETQTPQGVLGLFRRGAPPALPAPEPGARLSALVLAGLQDPLNLGALARTAWAFGARAIVTTAETVDPYHPRALRASSGALLHATIVTDAPPAAIGAWLAAYEIEALALVPHGGRDIGGIERAAAPLALVLGSEGHGIPREIEALCRERVTIPMTGELDSLGVAAAGAVALYALSRPRG